MDSGKTNTLVALWTGQLSQSADVMKSLAIHQINFTSKQVMLDQLCCMKSTVESLQEQLKKQVTE